MKRNLKVMEDTQNKVSVVVDEDTNFVYGYNFIIPKELLKQFHISKVDFLYYHSLPRVQKKFRGTFTENKFNDFVKLVKKSK